ncbi:hypothetical protein Sjap_021228 [Stephania japonica]|uniref:Uncharacterized protein n=1 Tax=Stephania japonica TaxID=461633 RepID=A0AAP0HTA0_9MAGN
MTHGGISFAGAGSWRLAGPVAERHVAAGTRAEVARLLAKIWETAWARISRQIDEMERGDGCACPRGGS